MRQKSESKMQQILDCVDRYFSDYGEIPSVRDIAENTGIAITTVHRYLTALKEWDLDGFKLDFIDSFCATTIAPPANERMDYTTVEDAVLRLMTLAGMP